MPSNYGPKREKCVTNSDCGYSTMCCSLGECQTGDFCYLGKKTIHDFCDNNYECQSRCCSHGKCGSSKANCFISCKKNSDCPFSGCCGDGHCVNDIICSMNKVNGDYCDRSKECVSELCYNNKCKSKNKARDHCDINQECKSGVCENNTCQLRFDINKFYNTLLNSLIILFSLIMFVMAFTFWL